MHDREWLYRLELFGIKLGLDTIAALLSDLGQPQLAYPVIHIAGTNGKGSVAAMVGHALNAAGYRTGRYTSPHLVRLEERFAIDGASVESSQLDLALARVRACVDRLTTSGRLTAEPTFFEVTTAVALDIFRNVSVDVAVVEVGLGGRLDATNVVAPVITGITSIDMDHEAQLGTSLAAIAGEKAGIIKHGVPVVIGDLPEEARAVILQTAAERGAAVISGDASDVRAHKVKVEPGRYELMVRTARDVYGPVVLSMRGRHQIGNAVVATIILDTLRAGTFALTRPAVEAGLREAIWPGRLHLVSSGDRRVLVDGAHNPAGMRALASYLSEVCPLGLPIVFGVMSDKDAEAMLDELRPMARPLILTRAPGRRAADPDALRSIARARHSEVIVEPDIAQALARAWSTSDLAAAAGSLYLVGEVFRVLDVRIP